jgi:glycine oxidase
MSELKGLRVVVAGAGAIGSVVALELARHGARVVLADPAPRGANASGVAAGMLAPLFETLLDDIPVDVFPLLRAARDAWPALLDAIAAPQALDRSGAMLSLPDAEVGETLLARAARLGAEARLLDADEARALAPGLAAEGRFLFTPDDWRLEAPTALAALQSALVGWGGRMASASVTAYERGLVRFDRGASAAADVVILCTGPKMLWDVAIPPGALSPIKGQIVRFAGVGPHIGPVVRGSGVYVAPGADGALAGATMEAGRSDLTIDPAAIARLRALAGALYPHLAAATPTASAGVRVTTRDGLPLVGPSLQEGVLVARGARRNGWLLAPLAAEVILDRLRSRPPSRAARAFDPLRLAQPMND